MELIPNPLSFRGYGEYAIGILDDTWTWYNIVNKQIIAKLQPNQVENLDFPIGRVNWTLQVSLKMI